MEPGGSPVPRGLSVCGSRCCHASSPFKNNSLLQSTRKLRSTSGINAVVRAFLISTEGGELCSDVIVSNITDDPEYWRKRRGGAHSGRANGGGPHQVAHAWDRGKLRKDSQMGRATSRRIALSETRDHGPERNYY